MKKKEQQLTYDEYLDWATRTIHDGLLRNGGRGMKSAVDTVINDFWYKTGMKKGIFKA